MFHRIYESMGLGMHPARLYPRRSRVAPKGKRHTVASLNPVQSVVYGKLAIGRVAIIMPTLETDPIKRGPLARVRADV